ncbi:MAG: hemolysin III [Candidatus Accumulibacter sp. 66-26]|nr:hemolysin III family protein [Accumulibacter sp.]OJW50896.1 MAG: hemolysin III [Candidatus Accumulibacter sp. 66-26]
MTALPSYSPREELANGLTHGAGLLLAIAGLGVLLAHATQRGDVWHVVGCTVFGLALIACYATSTLYHSVRSERLRPLLRTLDHAAIFLLIAGTYTPFTLVSLRGPWGWSLFGVVWGLALLGIALRLLLNGRLHGLVVALYLAMGWVVVIAVQPMLDRVAPGGLALLAGGGLAYTGGVVFYKWKRLPYNHAIWHLFVLLGSALHFFAVLFYVVPWPPNAA